MKSYKNFEVAISNFAPDLQSSFEDGLNSIDRAIKNGYIDRVILKEEVKEAFLNPYFNWLEFVFKNNVLIPDDLEPISNKQAKEYVRSLIWEYLFPEIEEDIDTKLIA